MSKVLPSLVVVTVVVVAVVAAPNPVDAHFEETPYTWGNSSCSGGDISDPVSFVFYATSSGPGEAAGHVEHHTDWSDQTGGDQWFLNHGRCTNFDAQRGSNCCYNRWHVRLEGNFDRDKKSRRIIFGTPHHEDLIQRGVNEPPCHAVDSNGSEGSGFDQGRRALVNAMRGNHRFADSVYWGNTQSIRQCDGDWAGSNGTVVWYELP